MISLHAGFTLIETLVSVALSLIVLSFFYTFTTFLYQDYVKQSSLSESLQESRVATSFFQSEIQNAGLDPTGTAFQGPRFDGEVPITCVKDSHFPEPILEASETIFHFMGDKNGSGVFNQKDDAIKYKDTNEDVRYEWVGKEGLDSCKTARPPYILYRDTGGHPQEVAVGIQHFQLKYFDEHGNPLPSGLLTLMERIQIRKVVLTLKPLSKENTQVGTAPANGKHEWISETYLKNMQ